jgi:hypothetical protein
MRVTYDRGFERNVGRHDRQCVVVLSVQKSRDA